MKLLATSVVLLSWASRALAQSCPPGSMLLELEIHFKGDLFTEEDDNTYFLTNLCDNSVVFRTEVVDDFEEVHELYCLNPYNRYKFTITDFMGDGLSSYGFAEDGWYSVKWDGNYIVDPNAMEDSTYHEPQDYYHESEEFGNPICFGTSMMVPLPAGGGGDPHFKTWSGKYFDFHGACDLVFMSVPNYSDGLGLELHVRTKVRFDYSFIESAALRIGEDILEVSGFGDHMFNGIASGGEAFDAVMGHFSSVTYQQINENKHVFEVKLEDDAKIILTTFKDWVSITIDTKTLDKFKDCVGLIGSTSGKMVGRDGMKNMAKDPNAYGQEWQVRDNESKLFQNVNRFPQYPEACVMPEAKSTAGRRKLGETITEEQAKAACAKWNRDGDVKACVFDVISSGDLDMAEAGGF